MSGHCCNRLPGTALFGRVFSHAPYILLVLLIFIMEMPAVVNALVPSGYYPGEDPVGVCKAIVLNGNAVKGSVSLTCERKSVTSDVDFSESIFTTQSDLDIRPGLIWMKQPNLPVQMQESVIEGRVLLHVLVGESGQAKEVKIIEESPTGAGLGQCCLAAAQKAVYSPGIKGNKPVKCWVEIPVVFKRSD